MDQSFQQDCAGSILHSLRRIIHSIDQHNKQISSKYKMTVPQLVCLRQLLIDNPVTPGALARSIYLSQATVTGILDRLEKKGLVTRTRGTSDRRRVHIELTEEGKRLAEGMPWPLQERFAESLGSMPESEQVQIDETLKRLVEMMEAPRVEVWPYGGTDVVPLSAILPQEDTAK